MVKNITTVYVPTEMTKYNLRTDMVLAKIGTATNVYKKEFYLYTPEEHAAVQEALLEEFTKGVKEGLASPNAASALFPNQKKCLKPCAVWAIEGGHCTCYNERPFERFTLHPESSNPIATDNTTIIPQSIPNPLDELEMMVQGRIDFFKEMQDNRVQGILEGVLFKIQSLKK